MGNERICYQRGAAGKENMIIGYAYASAYGTRKAYSWTAMTSIYIDKERYYFIIAACMGEDWVNAPAMWECYKKAGAFYEKEGIADNLVLHFHKEGHAVLEEDAEMFIGDSGHMYYGTDNGIDMDALKITVFEGQD